MKKISKKKSSAAAPIAKKPRVLLVEDDALTRESVSIKLRLSGFDVISAEDGESGLKKLRSEGPFSAILLDLVMPGVDGFKFLEEKKADPEIRDVMVIIFSNLSQKEDIRRAAELGAKHYLVKANNSLQEIVTQLTRCLKGGKECSIDSSIY